jgi:hypothetical protein
MSKKLNIVKGGFPRIQIDNVILKSKSEKGFSNNIYSIKDMLKSKKTVKMVVTDDDTELNIVDDKVKDRTINGISLSLITGEHN